MNDTLYQLLIPKLIEDAKEGLDRRRGRMLVVGTMAEDLILNLAESGIFVTVCGISMEEHQALTESLAAKGTLIARQTKLDSRRFLDITFEASSFDGIIVFDYPHLLDDPKAHLKMMRRFLKAGARLFLHLPVNRRPMEIEALKVSREKLEALTEPLAEKLPAFVLSAMRQLKERLTPEPGEDADLDELLEVVGSELKLLEVRHHHPVLFDTVDALAKLKVTAPSVIGKTLDLAQALEARIAGTSLTEALGKYVTILASKELELGRVFMPHLKNKPEIF